MLEIKLQLTLQFVMQNMMAGHHQLAMTQHQRQNHDQHLKKRRKNLKTKTKASLSVTVLLGLV